MPVPWVQIVQWVPSILEVSRQLLQETRKRPSGTDTVPLAGEVLPTELAARIAALEENERRLAELINRMAEHIGQLTEAVTALHKQLKWLLVGQAVLVAAVIIAALAVK
jgi:hypothetical protein